MDIKKFIVGKEYTAEVIYANDSKNGYFYNVYAQVLRRTPNTVWVVDDYGINYRRKISVVERYGKLTECFRIKSRDNAYFYADELQG